MTPQEILDSLNLGQAGKDMLPGIVYGLKVGSTLAGAASSAFPPLAPVFALAGAYYGTIIGAAAGFINGLFSTDHAAQQRRATAVWKTKIQARAWLDNFFATASPAYRDAMVKTDLYRNLVAMADLAKYVDPLAVFPAGPAREALRERLRVASITPENPQGTILGDPAIVAQVQERLASAPADPALVALLAKVAQDAAAGKAVDPADLAQIDALNAAPPRTGEAAKVIGVLGTLAAAIGGAWWWKRRKDKERSER